MPDYSTTLQQQINTAKQQMQQEYPERMAGTSIEPMGWFGNAIAGLRNIGGGSTQALTNPFTGNVSYNPTALYGQSQEDINNVLAHELTHTQQVRSQPWYRRAVSGLIGSGSWDYPVQPGQQVPSNYQPNPQELEAFQTESDRTLSQHLPSTSDVWLQPDRKKGR